MHPGIFQGLVAVTGTNSSQVDGSCISSSQPGSRVPKCPVGSEANRKGSGGAFFVLSYQSTCRGVHTPCPMGHVAAMSTISTFGGAGGGGGEQVNAEASVRVLVKSG